MLIDPLVAKVVRYNESYMSSEPIAPLNKEKLAGKEDQKWDQSLRAEAVLEQILDTEFAPQAEAVPEERVTVAEAIAARPVIDQDTGRARARVLIVTTDENVLLEGSSIRTEYAKLAAELDELHVMCVIPRAGKEAFDRAGDNVWFYQVRAKNWWSTPWAARTAALEALTWNGAPRPDIVVGVDMFEAGWSAWMISRAFDRPLQYHVFTDPFHPEYVSAAPDNNWRLRVAKFLLRRAKSVRTGTNELKEILKQRYKRLTDISTLPRFYQFTNLLDGQPAFNLHERFRDYVFIMLAFGPLTAGSHLHDLFAALHRLLRNPRIGLVVVGDGPAKNIFLEKVKILGIEKNVVFHKEVEDLVSYLKSSDLLVEMGTDEESEIRVLQAAAAGLPAVMRATALRRDLFKDGVSGFLCEPDDLLCVTEKVSKYVNTPTFREQFSENAQDIAKERLHENPTAHYQALALAIESVLASGAE